MGLSARVRSQPLAVRRARPKLCVSVVADPIGLPRFAAVGVIAGSPGQYYGCKHSAGECDTVCAISLRDGALDDMDQAMFDTQVLRGLPLPALERSLELEDEDRFDSLIFGIFDYVSRASLKGRVFRADVRVQRMKRFIERHAFEDISLTEIARSVQLSPFTCIRQFKSAVGSTPLRYLQRLRLDRARTLLKDRRLTIEQVARKVGIRDRFYFSRLFSREIGVPPQKFRQLDRV